MVLAGIFLFLARGDLDVSIPSSFLRTGEGRNVSSPICKMRSIQVSLFRS